MNQSIYAPPKANHLYQASTWRGLVGIGASIALAFGVPVHTVSELGLAAASLIETLRNS